MLCTPQAICEVLVVSIITENYLRQNMFRLKQNSKLTVLEIFQLHVITLRYTYYLETI